VKNIITQGVKADGFQADFSDSRSHYRRNGLQKQRAESGRKQRGELLEVFGDLAPGDQIASRGTDELRPGLRVAVKKTTASR
jgi:hypothetical protein